MWAFCGWVVKNSYSLKEFTTLRIFSSSEGRTGLLSPAKTVLNSSTLVGIMFTIWNATDGEIPSSFNLFSNPAAFSALSLENFTV